MDLIAYSVSYIQIDFISMLLYLLFYFLCKSVFDFNS